jgi:hypothetical protein
VSGESFFRGFQASPSNFSFRAFFWTCQCSLLFASGESLVRNLSDSLGASLPRNLSDPVGNLSDLVGNRSDPVRFAEGLR